MKQMILFFTAICFCLFFSHIGYSQQSRELQPLKSAIIGIVVDQQNASDLIAAAQRGDLNGVRAALSAGGDPNQRNEKNLTALMLAVTNGHIEVAKILIDSKAKVDETTTWGSTALHIAADKGNTNIVALLLKYGADPNHRDSKVGMTALHFAAQINNVPVARLLLQAGAKPNTNTKAGASPLQAAIELGNDAVADVIREALGLKERMQSLRRLHLSVFVPYMPKVIVEGGRRTIVTSLKAQILNTPDEHWTPLVRRAVEDVVTSFGVTFVETGQDADLKVTFHGYRAFSPDTFQRTTEVLFNATVALSAPDLGQLYKYKWIAPFISPQGVNNYAKYFNSTGEANETAILTDFREMVKANLTSVLTPPASKTDPAPKADAKNPLQKKPSNKRVVPNKRNR